MKVVINKCFGGFGLSADAMRELYRRGSELVVVAHDNATEAVAKERFVEPLIHFGSYIEHEGKLLSCNDDRGRLRTDDALIAVVEAMGDKASVRFASLRIVEIPDDVEWEIDEHDGLETVREKHRSWS